MAVAGVLAAIAAVAVSGISSAAPLIKYPNFSSIQGLKLNGDAAKVGNVLRLTEPANDEVGSAFTKKKKVDSRESFKTRFRISLHDGSGGTADGLAFVLSGAGKGALGGGGGGLGYAGIESSVAVEIDTFQNFENTNEPPDDHYAVVVGGDHQEARAAFAPPFGLAQNDTFVWVDYKAKRKRLKVFGAETGSKPASPFINEKVNLKNLFNARRMRAGFTASTGGDFQAHDVLAWKLKQRQR